MVTLLVFKDAPATTELTFGPDEVPSSWTDLTFSDASTSTHLVFGAQSSTQHSDQTLGVAGNFALPVGVGQLHIALPLAVVGTLPALTGAVAASYASLCERPMTAQVLSIAQIGAPVAAGITQAEQHAAPLEAGVSTEPLDASAISASTAGVFEQARRIDQLAKALAHDAVPAQEQLCGVGQDASSAARLRLGSGFKEAWRTQSPTLRQRFEDCLHDRRSAVRSRFSEAAKRPATRYRGHAAPGVARSKGWGGRFQEAWVLRPGVHAPVVAPVAPAPNWGPHLVFSAPYSANLNLVFGQAATPAAVSGVQILPARFYMTAHTIYAQRLPDLTDIPIYEATVAADAGSFCWSLSASGPVELFAQLAPVDGLPARLRLTLDGIPFVFAVDAMARNHRFGQTGLTISGRSVTALIGAPYLRATTRNNAGGEMLAQQLALGALQYSGVDLDWGLTDWMVSAGAWSHQGTPLDAVQAIAQAAGGYLQSHRSAATLLARHPYAQRVGDLPGAPWGWSVGAADVELAQDAVITEGIERRDGPDINAVYVSGTTQGVLALVKRTGSAGDKLAAMVSDPLVTHVDVARQRGLAILGAAGHKYHVVLDLPVLTGTGQPGVLDVGQLVQVNAATPWRGRVRGVSVAAKRPSLRQTVTLERHLETV